MKRTILLLLAAFLMVSMAAGAASAKTLFLSEITEIDNGDSLTWVDAFSADIRLRTYNNQCIELRFSTEALTTGGVGTPHIAFQALIDGTPANPAAEIFFEPSEFDFFDTANFAWHLCGLNIGMHTVQVQFSPNEVGNTAILRAGSFMIQMKAGRFAGTLLSDARLPFRRAR
jgi:hypothetical protein